MINIKNMKIENSFINGSSNTIISNNKIVVNGVEIPPVPNGKIYNSTTIIDNKVYINGYELKNGKWRRTIKALFYYIF